MGKIIPWTEAEFETLRRLYPEHGCAATARALPGRSEAAVQFKAWQLRVSRLRQPGRPRRKSAREPRKPRAARAAAQPPQPMPRAAEAPPAPPQPAKNPAPPKPKTLVLKAGDIRPGMIVNRYPVGTSAAPALREVTEARFSDAGSRVFFNLAWRATAATKGKHEMPAALWDFYRNPDLSFEVYVDLQGGLLS